MPLDNIPLPLREAVPLCPAPLVGDRYAECVEIYEAASDQRALLQRALVSQIGDAYAGRPLRILSVGSGSGVFDAALLEQLAPRLGAIGYTGVDPSARQCALARERFAPAIGPALNVGLINDVFGPSCVTGRYDVVQFVHCLYYFSDPAAAVDIALDALAPGGRLIIAHAPDEALNALAAQFWAQDRGQPSWFSGDVRAALAERGLTPTIERIDARLDASGCPGCTGSGSDAPGVTVVGRAVADFIAQVEIARLPAAIQAETFAYLGEIVQSNSAGGYFPHPVDMLTVVNEMPAFEAHARPSNGYRTAVI